MENNIKKHKMNGSLLPAGAWQAMERWGVEMAFGWLAIGQAALYIVYTMSTIFPQWNLTTRQK